MAPAAARAAVTAVAAVSTAPAVLVVGVVRLIAEGISVSVMPGLRLRCVGAGAAASASAERAGPTQPRAERARAERPAEPTPSECAERGLDCCDRVGGV